MNGLNAFWLTVLNWWVRVKPPSGLALAWEVSTVVRPSSGWSGWNVLNVAEDKAYTRFEPGNPERPPCRLKPAGRNNCERLSAGRTAVPAARLAATSIIWS